MTSENNFEELEWISPDGMPINVQETFWEKFQRKFKENPFVPLGLVVTSTFIFLGIKNIGSGNARRSQMLMRGRVLSQGLTVAALIGGILLSQKKK